MKFRIPFGIGLLMAFLSSEAPATVFHNFEGISSSVGTPFTIGSPPESATFSGEAFSGVAGIGELYHSGAYAWMVLPDASGTIEFDENAYSVEFWTRIRTGANGGSTYTVYDGDNQVIDSLTISTPGPFQFVSFTGDIDRIEVINEATGVNQMNSIDDITFSIPVVGDLNGDGNVTSDDINPFVQALTNLQAYEATYPQVNLEIVGDVNGDSNFNLGDVQAFKLLVSSSSAIAAPSPSTFVLASCLFTLLLTLRHKNQFTR